MQIRLDWTFPTPSLRQRPIAAARIEARLDPSLPWTVISTILAPQSTMTIDDPTPGNWEFRLFVVDTNGDESIPVIATAAVGFDPPSAATAFSATVIP
jgi:hypothetical protein